MVDEVLKDARANGERLSLGIADLIINEAVPDIDISDLRLLRSLPIIETLAAHKALGLHTI